MSVSDADFASAERCVLNPKPWTLRVPLTEGSRSNFQKIRLVFEIFEHFSRVAWRFFWAKFWIEYQYLNWVPIPLTEGSRSNFQKILLVGRISPFCSAHYCRVPWRFFWASFSKDVSFESVRTLLTPSALPSWCVCISGVCVCVSVCVCVCVCASKCGEWKRRRRRQTYVCPKHMSVLNICLS
jgi:hypothetical protein